jgi:hypothetical protein
MTAPDGDAGGRVVTWTALPDRDADRFRLVVFHLAAGVPVVIGLAVLVLLAFAAADGLAVENVRLATLVVLALVGGPASLVYLLLAVEYGSEREVRELTPSIGWFRLRYAPVSLLGGGILLLSAAIQPGLLLVFPVGLVVCKTAVDLRYTVGRIHPETATLRQVSGTAAAEYAGDGGLDTDDRRVRTFDLSPLRDFHQRQVGDYAVFVPRYRSRGWWGRPLVLVVPNDIATEVRTAFDTVIRTNDWTPGGGLDPAVRIVLGGLGVLFVGTAGGLAAAGTGAFPVVAYAATTLGLFGATMLFFAVRG